MATLMCFRQLVMIFFILMLQVSRSFAFSSAIGKEDVGGISNSEIIFKSTSMNGSNYFNVRNISLKRAAEILAKNKIEINDCEATIILDFLYHIDLNHNKHEAYNKKETLTRNRT